MGSLTPDPGPTCGPDPVFASFAAALPDPDRPPPAGLVAWNGLSPGVRLEVYRNNVVALAGALAETFPVTRELVGGPDLQDASAKQIRS